MTTGESSNVALVGNDRVLTTAVQPAGPNSAVSAWIDFAHVMDRQLLVYGWVLGFARFVDTASITVGGVTVDLAKQAIPLHRPDVARHFSFPPENDEHGFYALVDLPSNPGSVTTLTLSVALVSGETGESRWPVSCHEPSAVLEVGQHATTLTALLQQLPKQDAKRLIEFVGPALGLQLSGKQYLRSLSPAVRFEIDLCCLLGNRLFLVCGWFLDPRKEISAIEVHVGGLVFPFLGNFIPVARSDITPELPYGENRGAAPLPGFVLAQSIQPREAEPEEARFKFAAGTAIAYLSRPVVRIQHDAHLEFLSSLSKTETESALVLIEQVAMLLEKHVELRSFCPLLDIVRQNSIARLPPSVQHADPRFSLHVDRAIPIAEEGVFLTGWFDAEPATTVRIVCYCGSSSFAISDTWSRHARPDVITHLANLGIQPCEHELGFFCYVPLGRNPQPCYLSAILESGESRRMRVAIDGKRQSGLQAVHTLLSTFDSTFPDLAFLFEHQVGPAVRAVWAARPALPRRRVERAYGAKPADPPLSIIVPLYGRHDFAEYQMALFADDPEFQNLELIYVVDDPSISADFARLCPDLYGMYQVPFVLTYSAANLGFAGANNLGAEIARGPYLLFVNSDVLPRRNGWAGDLLRTYKSLREPGLLGAKLLYEDGSVQHAGMAFRRYPGWGNLWINDHPLKGQSSLGLNGVREVSAVTAACALIGSDLYRELGGFCEDYIIGDFEDSDLCLRASTAGRRNYVDLDVELYHLERQSQNRMADARLRTNLTTYNCWLHNHTWAKVIETRERERAVPSSTRKP